MYNEYTSNPTKYNNLLLLPRGDIGWVFTDDNLEIESLEHEKALNIALNKISGDWDYPKLTLLLDDLITLDFDISLTGFNTMDLDDIDSELDTIDIGDTTFEVEDENNNFGLIVEFENEREQSDLFKILTDKGYNVKLI